MTPVNISHFKTVHESQRKKENQRVRRTFRFRIYQVNAINLRTKIELICNVNVVGDLQDHIFGAQNCLKLYK
mgnify:CR=1 FL=1